MLRWVGRRKGPGGVRRIEVPDEVRRHCTLPRVDHADAFVVDQQLQDVDPEAWARNTLSDAPLATRATLLAGWSSLGLTLGRGPQTILGWHIEEATPEVVLLGARSRIASGLSAQLLLERRDHDLVFSTFVEFHSAAARRLWVAVEPFHVRVVPELLEDGRARFAAASGREAMRPSSKT